MQDKNQHNDKDKLEKDTLQDAPSTGTTAEDGVVYVQNDDGTPFDSSDRTYVTVEGLEGEIGSDDSADDDKMDNAAKTDQ